jgi:hypothetical protein
MNIPMLEKYVDEAVGVWIIFGEGADDMVDVADQTRDVFAGLPRDVAEKVVELQSEFRDKLYALLCDFGDRS